jgi:hypothetical protein
VHRIGTIARRSRAATAAGSVAVALLAGCQAPRGPVSVDSEDPDLHVLAIQRDVAEHDERDDPQLVRGLDDPDPAIRFYSIEGLRRLTGDEFGYRYYDGEDARKPAVARWRAWLGQRAGR